MNYSHHPPLSMRRIQKVFAAAMLAASLVRPSSAQTASAPVGQDLTTLFNNLLGQGASLRTLHNAADPKTFGAKGDGLTDDSAAFQSALNHGDVIVSPGTYLLNSGVYVPSAVTLQCQPGAVLMTTRHDSISSAMILMYNVTSSDIVGCALQGGNTTPAYTAGQDNNVLLSIIGGGRHTILGNVFKNSWAYSAFQISGGSGQNTVEYNSFESNAAYGLRLIGVQDSRITFNRFIDSSLGNEVSGTGDVNSGNVFTHNLVQKLSGNGIGDVFLTGGRAPNGFNYGGDTVDFNVIKNGNLYTAVSGGTNANYVDNQINPVTPPAISVAPVGTGDPFALSKYMTTLLGDILGQGVPLPTLYNYHLVQAGASFGGFVVHGDGATDDTAAIQAALDQGDIVIAPGTYRIDFTNGSNGINVQNYRNIQCVPGAVLYTTIHNNLNSGIFKWNGASFGNLMNCSLQSTNTQPSFVGGQEWNFALYLVGSSQGFRGNLNITGNHFSAFWANSEIQFYGDPATFGNSVILGNLFDTCGGYSVATVSGEQNLIGYNKHLNCFLGNEADNTNQTISNNDYIHNVVTNVTSDGFYVWSHTGATSGLTGGTAPCGSGFDYSTNRVFKNLVEGPGSQLDIDPCYVGPTGVSNPPKIAFYYANICNGPNCTIPDGVTQNTTPPATPTPPSTPPPASSAPAISLTALKAASPITIDGSLADWSGAQSATFTGLNNSATVYALWDSTNLYLAFKVNDTQLNAVPTVRDSTGVWTNDAAEVFLDTLNNGGTAMQTDDYHFIVDLNNTLWDSRGTGTGEDVTFNAPVQSAVAMQGTLNNNADVDSGYVIEMAIPFASMAAAPSSGTVMGFDLSVSDLDAGGAFNYFDLAGISKIGQAYAQPNLWVKMQFDGTLAVPAKLPPARPSGLVLR